MGRWAAHFVGGPYDGAEALVVDAPEYVAVKRVKRPGMPGKTRLSVIGNPSPTPPGYELYRLEALTDEDLTYVHGDVDFSPPDPETSASMTRDMEYA